MAADPGQEAGVVNHRAVGQAQPEALGQPQRDQALPEHVLYRLTDAEVAGQRQRGEQFSEPRPGLVPGTVMP